SVTLRDDLTARGGAGAPGGGAGGDVTFNGSVLLAADVTIDAGGGLPGPGVGGTIVFNGTLDSAPGSANALTLNTGGITSFGGALLAAAGAIDAGGGLPGPGVGGTIVFNGTLDSAPGSANALTLNPGGITRFGGAVGMTDRLGSLTTDAGGTTEINGPSIATL